MTDTDPDDRPITVDEVRGWLESSERSLRLTRSFRQRYLATPADERRELLRRERPGNASLTDINTSIAHLKANVAKYEQLLQSMEGAR